jgi:hypothetical protein
MTLAYPKPKDAKRQPKPAVRVFRDGREVCDLNTKGGRDEYSSRVRWMWEKQGRKCGLQITPQCHARNGRLSIEYAQFGHARSRKHGGGARDDRVQIDGKPTEARALCPWCNSAQGSRPITDFVPGVVP